MIIVKDKTFTLPVDLIVVQGEKGVHTLEFNIQDTVTSGASFYMMFRNSKHCSEVQAMTQVGSNWTWAIDSNFTHESGTCILQILAKLNDTYVWETEQVSFTIQPSVINDSATVAQTPLILSELIEARDTAVASAESAEDSAEEAEDSADTATDKADEASASATAAANSATSASNSATSATNSATAAANSATSASNSATAASASAESAEDSAESAEGSATSASTSATNAESAKTAAISAKETAVSAKDTAVSAKDTAVDKADDASASASAAASDASSASTSASTATQKASDAEAYALGTRGGTSVESTDPAYHNNSKYYAETINTMAINCFARLVTEFE